MTFEEAIKPYPFIKLSYEAALDSAHAAGIRKAEWLDYFLSKNCRAYFFWYHLKIEREASDQEVRDVSQSPIVPFHPSNIQFMLLEKFEKRMKDGLKFRQRVMKCRRAQVSTIYCAIGYHLCRFNENKKGLVFCDRLETSRKLRRILDIFWQTDDLAQKPEIGKKTLAEGLYLHPVTVDRNNTERDSFILLGSGEQANSGIGGSLDFLHWSEASLTADAERHWTTISPSLQGALFDVAESTPSMTGQDAIIFPEFEKTSENCDVTFISWLDVKDYRIDDAEQIKDFAPYVEHNLYGKEAEIIAEFSATSNQMLWRRFKLDEIKNQNAFRQVFPISKEEAFYSSAGLFFNKMMIEMVKPQKESVKEMKSYSFSDQGAGVSAIVDNLGSWKLYDVANIQRNYLVTVDVAEGKCADREMRDPDYSVAMVFKLDKRIEEVAFLRERIPPEVLAEQVACAAKYYNGALVIPERNGPGLALLVRLMQLYTNVYRQQKLQSGTFIMTQDYGFQTTSASKVHALSCLLSRIRDADKGVVIHTDIVHREMSRFAQTGVRYGALPGHHDDTISCLWLMAVCLSQTPSLIVDRDVSSLQTWNGVPYSENKIERDEWAYAN